jgi:asparagine synthase (glutamine-hydrolysing)
MDSKLPSNIVKRSKQAYRAPISHLVNGRRSSEAIRDIISNTKITQYGLFDTDKVERLKQKYSKGQNISEIDDMALTGIISSQLLYDQFIHNHNNWDPSKSNLNIKKDITV